MFLLSCQFLGHQRLGQCHILNSVVFKFAHLLTFSLFLRRCYDALCGFSSNFLPFSARISCQAFGYSPQLISAPALLSILLSCSSSVLGSLSREGFFVLVRTSVESGVLVVPALTQAVCSGCMDNVQENTVHTVVSPASSTAPVSAASSSSASLSLISKRAQKGKKNPPGSRNQQKKAHKAAVASALASSSARVACLSSELDDALSARDSARSDASRASAKARERQTNIRSWRTLLLVIVSCLSAHACSRSRGSRTFPLPLLCAPSLLN